MTHVPRTISGIMNKHHRPVGDAYWPTSPKTRGAPLPFDAVIFDLYGTLVDETTGTPERRAELDRVTQEIAAVLGAPQDPFMALWSSTVAQRATGVHGSFEAYVTALCDELGVAPSADSAADALGLRVDFFRDRLHPRPDALDTLASIRAKGLSVALISNCSWATEMLWPSTPFPPHFDAAILSCEVGMRKPDPAIYALACSRLGVAPERCLFVGDGRSGELPGAEQAGMTALRIHVPYESYPDAKDPWPGPEVSTLSQVLDRLT